MADRSLPAPQSAEFDPYHPVEYAPPHGPVSGGGQAWVDYEEEEESLNIGRYVAAIFRHKWLVLALFAAGIAAGLLIYRSVAPGFIVQATVWIEPERAAVEGSDPIQPRQLLSESGWVDLMRSFVVLDPVVQDLQLYVRPIEPSDVPVLSGFRLGDEFESGPYRLEVSDDGAEVTLHSAEGDVLERARPGEPLGSTVGFEWTPPAGELSPGRSVTFAVSHPRDAARVLSQELQITLDREVTFLRVALNGTDPRHITRVVNAVVERYVEVAAELKRAQLEERSAILLEQLEYAEENLREAEFALENFKVATISLPSEASAPVAAGLQVTQDPVFSNFFNLRVQQEEIRRDEDAIRRAMTRSREQGRLAVEALEVIPTVRESSDVVQAMSLATEKRSELRALELRYTEEHPAVRELSEDLRLLETQTIPRMLENLLSEVQVRRSAVDEYVAGVSQELQQIPPRVVEETRLERRYQSADNLARDLQRRYENARLAAASTISDVRILDLAQIPSQPNSDQRPRFFLMAAMAGLGLGILGAILRDRADPLLRYPDQVTKDLGLPILATIPHVRGSNGRLTPRDQDQVVEAFRNLRLAVSYAQGGSGPLTLTVTSPGIGDGKSFCTSNLALAFAELGHRTLIIDGDVRRGAQHSLFNRDRRPGLTDFLAGEADVDDVIRETDHEFLSVVPSGSRFRDGPELLGTAPMRRLMTEARSRFDVVVVDSPPMGAAVDPYLLGTLSGNLILVLRNAATDREFAGTRLADMDRLPVRVLGAVLNDVPVGAGAYRYYSYLPGYGVEDEDPRSTGREALAGAS